MHSNLRCKLQNKQDIFPQVRAVRIIRPKRDIYIYINFFLGQQNKQKQRFALECQYETNVNEAFFFLAGFLSLLYLANLLQITIFTLCRRCYCLADELKTRRKILIKLVLDKQAPLKISLRNKLSNKTLPRVIEKLISMIGINLVKCS